MNYTQNYHLPQWVESDRVLMEDFNDACVTLENTLTDHGQTLDTLQAADAANTAAHAHFGNCQLYLLSYVGTGGAGAGSPCTLTFPGEVHLVLISGGTENSWGAMAQKNGVLIRGGTLAVTAGGGSANTAVKTGNAMFGGWDAGTAEEEAASTPRAARTTPRKTGCSGRTRLRATPPRR